MNRERSCIGCKSKAQKENLLRVAKSSDGRIFVDFNGKGPGRGAYVCSTECLGKAKTDGSLARALRCRVDADVCTRLAEQAQECALRGFAMGSKE